MSFHRFSRFIKVGTCQVSSHAAYTTCLIDSNLCAEADSMVWLESVMHSSGGGAYTLNICCDFIIYPGILQENTTQVAKLYSSFSCSSSIFISMIWIVRSGFGWNNTFLNADGKTTMSACSGKILYNLPRRKPSMVSDQQREALAKAKDWLYFRLKALEVNGTIILPKFDPKTTSAVLQGTIKYN